MNIGIIGAGFTGLSAGYQLTKRGHSVTIFEKDLQPGGLAIGYKEKEWEWSLEKHYHHWFTNDKFILNLAREIGHKVFIRRPETSAYIDDNIYQLDSPLKVLQFPQLSIVDRVRMGVALAALRYNPFWQPLEKIYAVPVLRETMGEKSYKMLWEPQLKNKFGTYFKNVSLAWFWARIKKRTSSLAYPEGGFLHFAEHLIDVIKENGGNVVFNAEISELRDDGQKTTLMKEKKLHTFDKVLVTLPSVFFINITPQLPKTYTDKLTRLKGLGATNLVLRLNKPFFKTKTYWLSVCDTTSPIMAIVEHTNFMDRKYYNNEHIVYLGNYVGTTHPYFSMTEEEMLAHFHPFLKKINPKYKDSLISMKLFKAPFAQPIIPTNYSRLIPPMATPLKNVFLANIEQVYPWDRGTNYAVELGEKVAKLIVNE